MKRRSIKHILAALLLLGSMPASAESLEGWLEVAYTYYNPDWEFRVSESGLRLAGKLQRGPWFTVLRYNTIDTDPVGFPVPRARGLPFGNWRELTVGYAHSLRQATSLGCELSYQGFEVFDGHESGYSIGTSLQHRFDDRYTGSLTLAYLDLDEVDVRVTGEMAIALTKALALTLRIDDFAEYDFTWYEIGLRMQLPR